MSSASRFLMVIYSLLLMAAAGYLAALAAGWSAGLLYLDYLQAALADPALRLGIGAAAALFFLIVLKLMLNQFRTRPPATAVVESSALGSIRISLQALEYMADRAARKIEGVKELRIKIKAVSEGITLRLKISLLPDTNVPETSKKLQNTVKEYIEQTAGVQVVEVSIAVESLPPERAKTTG